MVVLGFGAVSRVFLKKSTRRPFVVTANVETHRWVEILRKQKPSMDFPRAIFNLCLPGSGLMQKAIEGKHRLFSSSLDQRKSEKNFLDWWRPHWSKKCGDCAFVYTLEALFQSTDNVAKFVRL